MKPRPATATGNDEETDRLRRLLVVLATIVGAAAALHLADHVVRGELVDEHNLSPEWNHSGWPFRREVTPFTPSLLIPLVFLGGVVLTQRRRLGARFWLAWSLIAGAVVVAVHVVPGPRTETMGVIYRSYDRGGLSPVAGALAVFIVVVIVVGLASLIAVAIRARRRSGLASMRPGGQGHS